MNGFSIILSLFFKAALNFTVAVFLFILIRKLIRLLIRKLSYRRQIAFYIPVIEFAIFFLIISKLVHALVVYNTTFGIIITGVFVFSLFTFLKNYIIGVVFRLTNRNITGSIVKINSTEGRVSAYLMTSIAIVNDKGEIEKVPFSNFYNSYSTNSINKETIVKIVLNFVPDNKLNRKKEEEVKNYLLNAQWVVLSKEINVDVDLQKNELKCQFHSLSDKHQSSIRKEIQDLL